MPTEPLEPRHAAMLVQGHEAYGIATIQKLYAGHWPEMTFVCFGRGPMSEWLTETGARLVMMDEPRRFVARSSLKAPLQFFAQSRQAKADALAVDALLADRGIRVVHTHRLVQQLVAGHMRPLGYKSVWQINNNMNRRRLAGMGRKLNHLLARWGADMLLPASDFIADNWQGSGVPMRTIRNAANRVVDPRPAPAAPPVRCLVAGRMDETKGHHTAVDAVLAARQAGYDVALDLYGGPVDDNPYADDLKRKVQAAGASDSIRLQGFCDDLRQRHGDYHLGLQCRIDPEPCSLWVCETMVDGLPLLASATGGTPELVIDRFTGILYPPGDSATLAQHLMDLCDAPEKLSAMRMAAVERGEESFLTKRLCDETLAAYRSLDEN